MKKSFLIVGVMGAILSTNGYADIVISDTPDMTITVARAAKAGTRVQKKVDSSVINQDVTDESEDDDVEKAQISANCYPRACCQAVWSGNTVTCQAKGGFFCQNATCSIGKKGREKIETAPAQSNNANAATPI